MLSLSSLYVCPCYHAVSVRDLTKVLLFLKERSKANCLFCALPPKGLKRHWTHDFYEKSPNFGFLPLGGGEKGGSNGSWKWAGSGHVKMGPKGGMGAKWAFWVKNGSGRGGHSIVSSSLLPPPISCPFGWEDEEGRGGITFICNVAMSSSLESSKKEREGLFLKGVLTFRKQVKKHDVEDIGFLSQKKRAKKVCSSCRPRFLIRFSILGRAQP